MDVAEEDGIVDREQGAPRLVPGPATPALDIWALLLAGGDGSRLRQHTMTDAGEAIPKQYCSINRERCLLQDAVRRAIAVAPQERICAVVASQHQRWWKKALAQFPPGNIFVQPHNRGTAFGILLGLLTLEQRARASSAVLLLPADHFVGLDAIMAQSLMRITEYAIAEPDGVFLLGAEPEGAEEGLGYIVPWHSAASLPVSVYSFVENPDERQAVRLVNEGALWNTFIISGSVRALLKLFEPLFTEEIAEFRAALGDLARAPKSYARLTALYQRLSYVDFSKSILEHKAGSIQVLRLPACGWTDLGTAQKLEQTARAHYSAPALTQDYLDLTRQFGAATSVSPIPRAP
jgi:mannose-1-phosphate guanylyltransferase